MNLNMPLKKEDVVIAAVENKQDVTPVVLPELVTNQESTNYLNNQQQGHIQRSAVVSMI